MEEDLVSTDSRATKNKLSNSQKIGHYMIVATQIQPYPSVQRSQKHSGMSQGPIKRHQTVRGN